MNYDKYKVTKGGFKIKNFDTGAGDEFGDKKDALVHMEKNLSKLAEYQDKLYAEGREALLVIVQAMDAAGKDGTIKHIFTVFNPAGVNVYSYKAPTKEELAHDYMWRTLKNLPERGKIAIFNRSYYEDVLVGKVHKLYESSVMPERFFKGDVIERRYEEISNFEKYFHNNGIRVLKFFLDESKEEQKKRFLDRIDDETKNWKFSEADITERGYWDDYMDAYEKCINNTSSEEAPWYVIPADKKWFARCLISEIVCDTLKDMNPKYPDLDKANKDALAGCRRLLLEEEE